MPLRQDYTESCERKWRRRWFYLTGDRLCFTKTESTVGDMAEVEYLPLDRIPMRPGKTGDNPRVGISLVNHRQIVDPVRFPKFRNCCISILCGNTVHYLVADFPQLAQRWITALTEAWERCALNDMRSLRAPETGLQALHSENRLLAENASLQENLAQAQDDLIKRDSTLWGDFLAAQERVLALQKKVGEQARTVYRVSVCTSANRGAETDGHVHVDIVGDVVLGQRAQSGERLLRHEGHHAKPFQRDQTDTFDIEAREDLGDLTELRVRHSPLKTAKSSKSWLLDHVKVTNMRTKAVTLFACDGWLAQDEVGEDCCVTLFARQPSEKQIRYTVDIFTANVLPRQGGSEPGSLSPVEARAYLVLQGSMGKSARIWLSKEPVFFGPGGRENMAFTGPDIGTLRCVKMGYETQDLGAAEWPLEAVHIRDVKKKKAYVLNFHRWLRNSGTEFECSLAPAPRPMGPSRCTISIRVKTGRGASSSGGVEVELFGANGSTGRIKLHPPGSIFETISENTFHMSLANFGEPKYLVVRHAEGAAWDMDNIEVKKKSKSAETFLFRRGMWDGAGAAVLRPTMPTILPSSMDKGGHEYHITTFTSQKKGSGTTARVFVKLYGDRSNSRVLKLQGERCFYLGGVDTFSTALEPLGNITSLKVGHDSSGKSPGWRLERVVITEKETGKDYTFWHKGVLKSAARQVCSVELVRDDVALQKKVTNYSIRFRTGDMAHASTDAQVFVKLMGSLGTTERLKLRSEKAHFERGHTDTFFLQNMPDVGYLEFLEVSTDNTGRGFLGLTGHSPNWFLEWASVSSDSMQRDFHFPCGVWFDDKEGRRKRLEVAPPDTGRGRSLQKELSAEVAARPEVDVLLSSYKSTNYELWIATSDIKEASTDAQVYVVISGNEGVTDKIWLDSVKAHFERGSNDYFLLENMPFVGSEIVRLEVGQDNTGRGFLGLTGASPNWHLSSVKVWVQETDKTFFFPCDSWLDKKRGLSRTLVPADLPAARRKSDPLSRQASPSPRSNHKSTSGDMDLQQSPPPGSPDRPASPTQQGPGKYIVAITTSTIKGASTDANVFVEFFGELGSSGQIKLDSSREHFERGSTDSFFLEGLPDIGPKLTALEIGHDSTGKGVFRGHNPDWHIDQVKVTNAATREMQIFPCGEWLGGKTAPSSRRLIPAELNSQEGRPLSSPRAAKAPESHAATPGEGQSPTEKVTEELPTVPKNETGLVNLLLNITTSDVDGASTDAAVSVKFYGENGVTELVTLQSDREHFERGNTDSFLLEGVEDVGLLTALEVGHDATGKGFLGFGGHSPSWHLDAVEVTDMHSRHTVRFPCGTWVGDNKTGGHVLLEAQPAEPSTPALERPTSSVESPFTTPRPPTAPRSASSTPRGAATSKHSATRSPGRASPAPSSK